MFFDNILSVLASRIEYPTILSCVLVSLTRFFVVEDHILNTTTGLVNRTYIDELWDMALSKIVAVLRTHSVGQLM